jgi:DNA-binding PadR family transcriptional regulator
MSVRHAILGVLTQGPMHGYHIAGELARRIGGGRYNSAQIYQSLHWLADRGLVIAGAVEPGLNRDRRPFHITAAGRREFQKWLRSPLIPSRPVRDDAVVKLVFLGQHDPRQLIAFLERLRRQHMRRLTTPPRQERARPADEHIDNDTLADLSAAALRFREEAELRWIDHCILRLRLGMGPQPAAVAAEVAHDVDAVGDAEVAGST